MERTFIAIDLKSFYASVECVERNLDPMTTNLVVADLSRTEKTICLAVSPSLKSFGISGRARLYEVISRTASVNEERLSRAPRRTFLGESFDINELNKNRTLKLDYIIAPPRMALYMDYSTKVYSVYLKYFSNEDIHPYSIDEVFIDATHYLKSYNMTPYELVKKILADILETTGLTAAAGIGTNLYLCKIAMDLGAKKIPNTKGSERICELDERLYRTLLWDHKPITDFWRVGGGIKKRLEAHGLFTMGDIAKLSSTPQGQEILYKEFGVNAEYLIDHAWGYENAEIADIKAYKPKSQSSSIGQVLREPYDFEKAKLVALEMAEMLALSLVSKSLETNQIVLTVGYDIENVKNPHFREMYGSTELDRYGREIPKGAHGSFNLKFYTASTHLLTEATESLFEKIVNPDLLVRRINLTATHVLKEGEVVRQTEQLSIFSEDNEQSDSEKKFLKREKNMQKAMLDIKEKYGKNAILKGRNLKEGATARDKNSQIGGHKA